MKNDMNIIKTRIKQVVLAKGSSLCIADFLKPELEVLIKNANLKCEDRRLAVLYFLEGKRMNDVMEANKWYSSNTFTRHKKSVIAELLTTARLIAERDY